MPWTGSLTHLLATAMLWTLAFVMTTLWALISIGGYQTGTMIHLRPVFAAMAVVGTIAVGIVLGVLIGGIGGISVAVCGGALGLVGWHRYLQTGRRTFGGIRGALAWRSSAVDHWARRWLGEWTAGSRTRRQHRLTLSSSRASAGVGGGELAVGRSGSRARSTDGLPLFWWH
jgi:hypothetical protein